jgi:hypothetical protein
MTRTKLADAIDAGVALLSGVSAAFVLFAMPEPLLARIFAATHLASLSRALQPPIGETTRLGLTAAAGLLALAFVWSLLKALDRVPAKAEPAGRPVVEADPEAPRLRKADAHPDAPARRPLLAGRDLGEPLDLEPAQAIEEEKEEEDEPFIPQPEPEAAPLPAFLVPQEPEPEPVEAVAVEATEPEAVGEEEDPDSEPLANEDRHGSITSLMQRFETGLARKKQALPERAAAALAPAPSAEAPVAEDAAVAAPAPVGHRLRSAIADLQRVSSR